MTKNSVYRASPIKRKPRRTKKEMEDLRSGLYNILFEDNPQTVRGVFYQAVIRRLVEKTEKNYKNAVQRNLVIMREEGLLPFHWIVDSSRWMRKPDSHDDIIGAIEDAQTFYRKALWKSQPDYVEIWMEKDTLAGIVYPVTAKFDVPLMVTHGFSSLSFIHESAEHLMALGKPSYIYFLTDYDPSGVSISSHIKKKLRKYAPSVEIHCKQIAVTSDQIDTWDLPTRPPKKSDSRLKNFDDHRCVELDAIPARMLEKLVEQVITSHISPDDYHRHLKIEQAERKSFRKFFEGFQYDSILRIN